MWTVQCLRFKTGSKIVGQMHLLYLESYLVGYNIQIQLEGTVFV